MNRFILALIASTAITVPAHAAGEHEGGHSRHQDQGNTSHGQHGTQEAAHDHGAKKGAVGYPAMPSSGQRTFHVSLGDDMRMNFKEDFKEIKSGEVIQFRVTNEGKIPHEFSIGNPEEQKVHAKMMRKMPGMTHNDGNTITLTPGETKKIAWHFEGDDQVVFSCNIPGHFEAGMFQNIPLKR